MEHIPNGAPLHFLGRLFVSALVSLLFLQTAMLEAFSEDAARGVTRNAWPGFGVIVLALFMILRAGKMCIRDRRQRAA